MATRVVVDTSALMAVLLAEETAPGIMDCLVDNELCLSAGTYAEALIVASSRGVGDELEALVRDLAMEVVPVEGKTAHDVGAAYGKWGKGRHPAGLNFGDCFAYALATATAAPLIFVGNDFAKTDVTDALTPRP